MNRENIIKLAREAGCGGIDNFEVIERFAALVAAHIRETEFKPDWNNYRQGLADGAAEEREACAKACEEQDTGQGLLHDRAVIECAAAIRARGQA